MITNEAVEALAKRNFEAEQGDGEWEHLPDPIKPGWLKEARSQAEAVAPFILAHAANEAFQDKKIQGLQRVLVGNWIRGRIRA